MPHSSGTVTTLDRANFRVLKARARGEDGGFYLLGFLPIVSPSVGDATDQLLAGVDSKDRAISLANVTQEYRSLYLVLFSLPRVVVRADVVEFVEESSTRAPAPAQAGRQGLTQPPASAAPRR
jgi:hypothetical protein